MDEQKVIEAIGRIEELRYLMPAIDSSGIPHLTLAIEALKKQLKLKPKKVYTKECVEYRCPVCGNVLKTKYSYYGQDANCDCFNCKQQIDWSEQS